MPIDQKVLDFVHKNLVATDSEVIKPYAEYTYTRDLPIKNDLSKVVRAVIQTRITGGAGQGTQAMTGRSWVNLKANDLKSVSLETSAEAVPVMTGGREVSWTELEVEEAQAYNLNLTSEKVAIVNDIFNQEAQYVGYLGDTENGVTGLLNSANVETDVGDGLLKAASPDVAKIIKALDAAMRLSQEVANNVIVPSTLLVSPAQYMTLFSLKMPDDNKVSLIDYLEKQSYAAKYRGGFKVFQVKELAGIGDSSSDRMLFYTPDLRYVKYSMLPCWRYKNWELKTEIGATYLWRMAQVQLRHPETLLYVDNL